MGASQNGGHIPETPSFSWGSLKIFTRFGGALPLEISMKAMIYLVIAFPDISREKS